MATLVVGYVALRYLMYFLPLGQGGALGRPASLRGAASNGPRLRVRLHWASPDAGNMIRIVNPVIRLEMSCSYRATFSWR